MARSTSSEVEPAAPRIVMQYFRGDILVCEMRCAGTSLHVHISHTSRDGTGDGSDGWRIEAHGKVSDEEVVISESRTTRSAALHAVGDAWNTRGAELGLSTFDWDAVAVALRTVRAIE